MEQGLHYSGLNPSELIRNVSAFPLCRRSCLCGRSKEWSWPAQRRTAQTTMCLLSPCIDSELPMICVHCWGCQTSWQRECHSIRTLFCNLVCDMVVSQFTAVPREVVNGLFQLLSALFPVMELHSCVLLKSLSLSAPKTPDDMTSLALSWSSSSLSLPPVPHC